MKRLTLKIFKPLVAGLCLASCLLVQRAGAVAYYFHQNGTSPGYGIVANTTYAWDTGTPWATTATGAPTVAWPATASDAHFNSSITPYTVTLNSTQNVTGLFADTATTVNVNDAGSGTGAISFNTAGQWGVVLASGSTLVLNVQVTGPGQVWPETSGTLRLYGNNTYTGGTHFGSGAPLVYFNNSNSFGSGTIEQAFSGTTIGLLGTGGTTITLTNNFAATSTATGGAGSGFNFAADGNTPVVLNGNWNLGTVANARLIQSSGGSTSPLRLHGVISGTASTLFLQANNSSAIFLDGASTYNTKTVLRANNSGVTVSVGGNPANLAFNNVTGGSTASNLGHPTTAANGTIAIGSTTFTCTLIYTGAGETTDRVIDMPGTTGGAILEADGTGALVFSSAFTATGAGAKTLVLQGSSTAANTIGGAIVDNSGANPTALAKTQAGKWVLAANNTFTGGTFVTNGTLEVSGKISSVTVLGGVLQLDNASALKPTAAVNLATAPNGSVNLNYSGFLPVSSLVVGGTTANPNDTWGAPGSGAANTSPIFTGSGKIIVAGAPIIVQEPQSTSAYPNPPDVTTTPPTFTVGVVGDPSFYYQWSFAGTPIPGANSSSYTVPTPFGSEVGGTYTCAISNNFSGGVFTNTLPATLTILATNSYVNAVLGDGPISYWRLDETNGTTANDWVGGNNGTYYNVNLNQPGYAVADPDRAIQLPADPANRGGVSVANFTPFQFLGAPTFTLEGWVNFTNLTGVQRLFSCMRTVTSPFGWGFGINGANQLVFTTAGVADNTITLATPLTANQWHYLVFVCDGNTYFYYVDGQLAGTHAITSNTGAGVPLQLGANPSVWPFAEQVLGFLDEMAIYNYNLSPDQVLAHYNAVPVPPCPVITSGPTILPQATNYVSLPITFLVGASGVGLSYQWYKAPSTPVGTGSSFTIPSLAPSDAGSYYVNVSNSGCSTNSPSVTLTVLPIPTNAAQLNVTNNLVLHLPFDGDYKDISGRQHNGTPEGAPTFVPGIVGTNALSYSTDTNADSFNYVTLGVVSDLKFSSNIDFTVSYWVQLPSGSEFYDLPFFTDANNSLANGGFCFAPGLNATGQPTGGWGWSLGSVTVPGTYNTPNLNTINDGNWHHLVHVAQRSASLTTYLDGVQVDSSAIIEAGDATTANAVTIGQDPAGTYPITASAYIDDLAVWTNLLTQLQVSGIYLAGASNNVSFAPPISSAPAPMPATITSISGTTLAYSGGAGSKFVLLGTNNVAAPLGTWTRIATNTTTPGTFTIPPVTSGATYYRVQSQ